MTDAGRYQKVLDRLEGVKRNGSGWTARCPSHGDQHASLSINIADDDRLLVNCHANQGCTFDSIRQALGLEVADFFPLKPGGSGPKRTIEATYDYRDEGGKLLFQVVRFTPKDFRQRRRPNEGEPAGRDGWIWGLKNTRRVIYNLDKITKNAHRMVFVVEGEKDADRLGKLGFLATTAPMGAGKWKAEYSRSLANRHVVICPDYDKPCHNEKTGATTYPGWAHALEAAKLIHPYAESVKFLEFGGTASVMDVSDWLDGGGTAEQIKQMVREAAEWEPGTVPNSAQVGGTAENPPKAGTQQAAVSEPETVTLTRLDVSAAMAVATRRILQAMSDGRFASESNRGRFHAFCEQAMADAAFAKSRGWWWNGEAPREGVTVRYREREGQELYAMESDDDDACLILVSGECPNYKIAGWIYAKDARREEWKRVSGGRTLWFVPPGELKPLKKG